MFARLTGVVDHSDEGAVILDVGGVGYLVTCSARTRAGLQTGQVARLFIETHVREEAINLYGFIDSDEQFWFKLLTTVQGVGAKVGMSILSTLSFRDMSSAIAAQDKTMFSRADGVGPKLAMRIVTELKDKIPESFCFGELRAAGGGGVLKNASRRAAGFSTESGESASIEGDAISALVNLGYTRAEAFSAIMKIKAVHDQAPPVSEMIRLALGELARSVA